MTHEQEKKSLGEAFDRGVDDYLQDDVQPVGWLYPNSEELEQAYRDGVRCARDRDMEHEQRLSGQR